MLVGIGVNNKWLDSKYTLKVEQRGFIDGFQMEWERRESGMTLRYLTSATGRMEPTLTGMRNAALGAVGERLSQERPAAQSQTCCD